MRHKINFSPPADRNRDVWYGKAPPTKDHKPERIFDKPKFTASGRYMDVVPGGLENSELSEAAPKYKISDMPLSIEFSYEDGQKIRQIPGYREDEDKPWRQILNLA